MRSTPFLLGFALSIAGPLLADARTEIPKAADVLTLMEKVGDWQIANPPSATKHPPDGWVRAAGYTGFMALGEISSSPRFVDAMREMAEKNAWRPGPRPYHADDQCVIQTYAELFQRDQRSAELVPSRERLDSILKNPPPGHLEFVGENKSKEWSWCDALFMAPPAWIRMWAVTKNEAYLDFAVTHWWQTSAYLYDPTEHLYFRDSTYFKKREANGQKIFWARGNGWVFAGLARMMQYLPKDHPARPKFEQQFREMAARLVAIQSADGFWRSSLLDPENYPAQEESGTGFFCFGLAWGINEGLLDRGTYLEPMLRAWTALNSCVEANGKLKHVQPVGADPKRFDPESTEPYGVGALLLAGREIYRLDSGK